MAISADFTINGVANPARHETTYGGTVNLALVNPAGIDVITWEVESSSNSGDTLPTITPGGTPTGATASFTFLADPTDGTGRTVLVKCTCSTPYETVISRGVVGVLNDAGKLPVCANEGKVRDAISGWLDELNSALAAGANAASGVTFDDTGLTYITAANVQAALEDVDAALGEGADNTTIVSERVDGHDAEIEALQTALSGGILALESASIGADVADGTYTNEPVIDAFSDTSGTGMTATIVVSGGAVTSVTVTAQGTGYAIDDEVYFQPDGSVPDSDFAITFNVVPGVPIAPTIESVLEAGNDAGGLSIANLGAVTSTNPEANGGSPTVSLAPDDTAQINALTTGSNANYDFAIGTDGVYRDGITVTAKMATAGTYLTADFAVHYRRESSTVTLIGSAIQGSTGDDAGMTVTFSGSSSNLRVNVANATGETVSGYINRGAIRTSLIS